MENATIFQFFHWYYSPEGNLWQHAEEQAECLAKLGITHVWFPPAYKSAKGIHEPGYAVYDLYDLGEFDQKGTVRTRYGTKEEYLKAIKAIQQSGMQALADIVLNHKIGADETEKVTAQQVSCENRNEKKGAPAEVEACTRFTFPGRKNKYSEFIWNRDCFTGFREEDGDIFIFLNGYTKGEWDENLSPENGNFDYLMGADIEFRNPYVREELKRWGCWYAETTGIDGFRLDGLKHIPPSFYPEWLKHMQHCFKKEFMVIGEYWARDVEVLSKYIAATNKAIKLFDVPLHYNFYEASVSEDYDLRTLFDCSLMKAWPELAITFVDNHDTQPCQALESFVEYWFKPLAYAIILLRQEGIPCVFYPAVYEGKYEECRDGEKVFVEINTVPGIEILMQARQHIAYGAQTDYWDDAHIVGWVRSGTPEKPHSGCAVLISNNGEGKKRMMLGKENAFRSFKDITGNQEGIVMLDENGEGEFCVHHRSVSVWADEHWKNK